VEIETFRQEDFSRVDDSSDVEFYALPRLVVHIDEGAIEAARHLYLELLPKAAALLDLMSSYRSHLPAELAWTRLVGLGMNAEELRANDQLTEIVVHDLNADPRLPFNDCEFSGAVMTVSAQYLTRPVEAFQEVRRILRPGAPFVLTYSNRMFPTKAVRIWRELGDRDRATLIATYFKHAGGFGTAQAKDCTIQRTDGSYNDPLYGVWAYRE
jgi:SAM-dependent methyltransferase